MGIRDGLPGVTPEDRRRTPVGLGQRLLRLFCGCSNRSTAELVLSASLDPDPDGGGRILTLSPV